MGEETVRVDPNEDLDTLIGRLKQSRSKDIVLVMPPKSRALTTLDNFQVLRKLARDEGFNFKFNGGNKTAQGLAKVLGFRIEPGGDAAEDTSGFTTRIAEQATMPSPAPQQQRTAPFETPVSGSFPAVATRTGNGNGSGHFEAVYEPAPPPLQTTSPDLFANIPDLNIPSIQPPPMPSNSGGQGFDPAGGNTNRGNLNSIHPSFNPGPAAPPLQTPGQAPAPVFDFANGGHTMTYEEAMTNGLLDGPSNLSNDFQFNQFNVPNQEPGLEDEEMQRIPAPEGDNAAAAFRRPGVRREEDFEDILPSKKSRMRPKGKSRVGRARIVGAVPAIGVPVALSGLGTRVRKFLNPVQASTVRVMERQKLSPADREKRRAAEKKTTFFVFIVIAAVITLGVLLILMSLLGGSKGSGNSDTPAVAVPQAQVNLIYKTQPVSNTVSLLLDTSATGGVSGTASQTNPAPPASATGGRLNVTTVNPGTIVVKSDAPYPSFGSKMQVTGTAQGNITIFNASSRAVGYNAGTLIYSRNGISYRLQNGISVPAGNVLAGTRGQGGGVVVADKAGPAGNLPQGFVVYISDSVAVQSGAISGGTEQPVKVVSPQDIEALKKQLLDKAAAETQNSYKDRYNPASQELLPVNSGEPKCEFTKNPGDVADSFAGSCSLNPQAYVYNKADLQRAVQDQLVTDPKSRVNPASVKIAGNGTVKTENNRMVLSVPVSGTIFSPVDLKALKEGIANKPVTEAQAFITATYPQVERVDFSGVKGDKMPEAAKIDIATTPVDPSAVLAATAPTTTVAGSTTVVAAPGSTVKP